MNLKRTRTLSMIIFTAFLLSCTPSTFTMRNALDRLNAQMELAWATRPRLYAGLACATLGVIGLWMIARRMLCTAPDVPVPLLCHGPLPTGWTR
jgi:hypothetical protein